MEHKGYMLTMLQEAVLGVLMWKNDCSVLRDDTAHHNYSRQQVDMVHLPTWTLSVLWPDDMFHPSQQLRTRTHRYQCTSIKNKQLVTLLKQISSYDTQIRSFIVKQDINQIAVSTLTYVNKNKWLQCGHLEEQMAAQGTMCLAPWSHGQQYVRQNSHVK